MVTGITNKNHNPNNENSSPLHEEHWMLTAQSVARLVAQVFHFLHSCATICGRATVTLGRASLIIWRKATHFVESCHSKYWSTKQSVVLQDLICAVQGKAQVSLSVTEEQFSKVSASTDVSLTPLIWQKVLGKQIGCAMHIMHIVHFVASWSL